MFPSIIGYGPSAGEELLATSEIEYSSKVASYSTYTCIGQERPPKDSDDMSITGYTRTGKLVMIAVDGLRGCDRDNVFAFVTSRIFPLMDDYSESLSQNTSHIDTTVALIKRIEVLRKESGGNRRGIEFTLSLAVGYEHINAKSSEMENRVAGFGIGDIMIARKDAAGTVETLVPQTEIREYRNGQTILSKDGFDVFTSENQDLDDIIKRNTVFSIKVQPGDEFVASTHALGDLKCIAPGYEKDDTPVRKYVLNVQNLPRSTSLFDWLLRQNEVEHGRMLRSTPSGEWFGDDTTVTRIHVPFSTLSELKAVIDDSYWNDKGRGALLFNGKTPRTIALMRIMFMGMNVGRSIEQDQDIFDRDVTAANDALSYTPIYGRAPEVWALYQRISDAGAIRAMLQQQNTPASSASSSMS